LLAKSRSRYLSNKIASFLSMVDEELDNIFPVFSIIFIIIGSH
jgi:hypothetical protein